MEFFDPRRRIRQDQGMSALLRAIARRFYAQARNTILSPEKRVKRFFNYF
jgi:hypothetical protein